MININHLTNGFHSPIAKFMTLYHASREDGMNLFVWESSYHVQNPLCVDAYVLLLFNFLVEYIIMNGVVGTIVAICYKHPNGPKEPHQMEYVKVDFP